MAEVSNVSLLLGVEENNRIFAHTHSLYNDTKVKENEILYSVLSQYYRWCTIFCDIAIAVINAVFENFLP